MAVSSYPATRSTSSVCSPTSGARIGGTLFSELRLRGIATREAANAFLAEFLTDSHPPAETLAA